MVIKGFPKMVNNPANPTLPINSQRNEIRAIRSNRSGWESCWHNRGYKEDMKVKGTILIIPVSPAATA